LLRFGGLFYTGKGYEHPPAFGNPILGFFGLTVSPGKSILLYSPPIVIALMGMRKLIRTERQLGLAISLTFAAYLALVSCLTFYGGDWSWGPRYFTVTLPLLALAFPFAPLTTRLRRIATATIVAVGVFVQLLGLSIDHHRFFYARSLPPFFWYLDPAIYFRESALFTRPGELLDSIRQGVPPEATRFRPGPNPELLTYAVFGPPSTEPSTPTWMRRYRVFWIPRPWPLWMLTIPKDDRPISLALSETAVSSALFVGLLLIRFGRRSTVGAL
jgi:hypothetical protein